MSYPVIHIPLLMNEKYVKKFGTSLYYYRILTILTYGDLRTDGVTQTSYEVNSNQNSINSFQLSSINSPV